MTYLRMHGKEIASASFTNLFWQHHCLEWQFPATQDHNLVTITTDSILQSTTYPTQVSELSTQVCSAPPATASELA